MAVKSVMPGKIRRASIGGDTDTILVLSLGIDSPAFLCGVCCHGQVRVLNGEGALFSYVAGRHGLHYEHSC